MINEEIINAVSSLVAENKFLKTRQTFMENTFVSADKFYDVILSVKEVAKLHGVSSSVVRKYISLGLIETHPSSSDNKFMVRASDALMLDFCLLKKTAKLNRYETSNS